jgi:N-acetylmuramoyl-L-alanine amidase
VKMNFRRLALLVLILFLALPAASFASGAEQAYQEARSRYNQLLASSGKQLYRENWEKVIQGFVAVSEKFPDHDRAAGALYMAGKAGHRLYGISRRLSDAADAVGYFESLVEKYPQSNLADDALVLAGNIYENPLDEPGKASLRYMAAVSRYPEGDMTAQARQRLNELPRLAADSAVSQPSHAPPETSAANKEPTGGGPRQLTAIRHWASPDYTRIVLELDGPVQFRSGSLPADPKSGQPARVYVDIVGARQAGGVPSSISVNEGILQRMRTGRPSTETLRVVCDLVDFEDFKVFDLPDPHRIVVDIAAREETSISALREELRSPPAGADDDIAKVLGKAPEDRPLKVKLPPAGQGSGLRRIVVDAGHGGKDPGAIGPLGTKEKDITLAIAKLLAKRLEEQFGCEVILTRDKDIFLPLEERTAIANRVGADLFISIHANASPNRDARGVETYYLNFSKNDKAAAVAARENGTSLKQVSDLEMILFDLMANSKINESSRLAAEIQKSLVGELGRHYPEVNNHGVRQGPFYVLLGATMPSVLVEAAFISNREEESRLKNRRFQEKAAVAIAQGVYNFAKASKMVAHK